MDKAECPDHGEFEIGDSPIGVNSGVDEVGDYHAESYVECPTCRARIVLDSYD